MFLSAWIPPKLLAKPGATSTSSSAPRGGRRKSGSVRKHGPVSLVTATLNQHQPQYQDILYQDENTVFITWFNAGLRVYDISIERQPQEIGYFIPPDPLVQRGPLPKTGLVTQSEDVVVDARGNVFVSDKNHGIYVLRFKRP